MRCSRPSGPATVTTSWAPFQKRTDRDPQRRAGLVLDRAAGDVLDVVLARPERRKRGARDRTSASVSAAAASRSATPANRKR